MAVNPMILARIFGGAPQEGQDPAIQQQVGLRSLGAMGAAMLANSTTHTGSAPGFGEVLGKGLQAGYAAQAAGQQNAQLAQLRQMQIDQYKKQAEQEAKRGEMIQRMVGGVDQTMTAGQAYSPQAAPGGLNASALDAAIKLGGGPQQVTLPGSNPLGLSRQEQLMARMFGNTPEAMQYLVQTQNDVETLSAEQASKLGLPEGSIVQRGPNGAIQVIREGTDWETLQRKADMQFGYDARLARLQSGLSSGGASASQEAVQAMLAADPNLDPATAINIEYGRYGISRDPISGTAQVIDKATGKIIGVTTPEVGQLASGVTNSLDQTLIPENLDMSTGTGLQAVVQNVANVASDVVGAGLPYPEVEKSIQAFNNLKTQTQIALSQEVAGRPSNYLLEQFAKLAVEPASLLQGDSRAKTRMQATQALVDQKIAMVKDVVNNPDQYRPAEVSQARQSLTGLTMLSKQYGEILNNFSSPAGTDAGGGGGGVTIGISQPGGPPPEGVPAETWRYMTPEERALWQ